MRVQLKANVALLTLVVAVSLASHLERPDSISNDLHRSKSKISLLFDFSNYKKLFNKSYYSLTEELLRQKLFWARAFRALISAVKYRTGQEKYYLAVNQMSDMTPKELQKMINDAHDGFQPPMQARKADSTMGGPEEEDGNELANSTSKDQAGDLKQDLLSYVESIQADLTKTELNLDIISDNLESLPIEQLIDNDDKVRLDKETEKKILDEVPSSRVAHTTPKASNPITISQWERVVVRNVKSNLVAAVLPQKSSGGLLDKFKEGWRKAFKRKESAASQAVELAPDEVFLDLRETKCFDLPRFQGQCGACYAFVMTSILEWLHCMKSGKLVRFSEQYMIDCGYDNIDTLDGCSGGNSVAAANFVRNFGIELRNKWPYGMRENECPYDENTPLESTGYFRFPLAEVLAVHLDMVPKQLALGPLYVSLMTVSDFFEYGGGVHGFGCKLITGNHAMTLVGHGRENGQEYWLLRNSYGPGWGEDGYYKLAKLANCIMPPRAYVYGSTDQTNEAPYFGFNELRDEDIVKRHYNEITAR